MKIFVFEEFVALEESSKIKWCEPCSYKKKKGLPFVDEKN